MTDTHSAVTCQASSSYHHGDGRRTKTRTEQERVESWQADLDATVQLVNTGKLTQAWKLVATIMRDIESFDSEFATFDYSNGTLMSTVQHGPMLEASRERISSICLKLIDLECALSFFVGGASHLSSWSQGRFLSLKIAQHQADDHLFAVKIKLYTEIQDILQTDVSQKDGLRKFLNTVREMNPPYPATELIKISLCTNENDPVGMQELRLISHLCLMILYCRIAVVSDFYAEEDSPAPCDGSSDIIRKLQLDSPQMKGKNSYRAKNHAHDVLRAFERLCELDPEGTARSWFRLCGALIAAIIVAVAELRGQMKDGKADKDQLPRVAACFEGLSRRNTSSPIFEGASEIFQKLGTKTEPSSKAGDPTADPSFAESQITSSIDVKSVCPPVAPPHESDSEVARSETLDKRKREKMVKSKALEIDAIVSLDTNENVDVNCEKPSIRDEHSIPESLVAPYILQTPHLNMNRSFVSTGNTFGDHSLLDGTAPNECRLYHVYSAINAYPPLSIWVHSPRVPYGDDWYWCTCRDCCFYSANMTTTDTIASTGQPYLEVQPDATGQPYPDMVPTDSFGDSSTMVTETHVQTPIQYTFDETATFQMSSDSLSLGQARALTLTPSSSVPPESPRESDAMLDLASRRHGPWNGEQTGVDQVQRHTLPGDGGFRYDNGTMWDPATLTQLGRLGHAYEYRYDRPESPGMGTPASNQCATLPDMWVYRNEQEWSSAESSFCDDGT